MGRLLFPPGAGPFLAPLMHLRRRAAARPVPWGEAARRSCCLGSLGHHARINADQRGSVADGTPGPAGADEIEPDPAVAKLDGRAAEPSPPAHDDPPSGTLKDRHEILLHVRVQAAGCPERKELVGYGPIDCRPAQMEITHRDVPTTAPRREIVEHQAPMSGTHRQLLPRFARPDHRRKRIHASHDPITRSLRPDSMQRPPVPDRS